MHLLLFRDCSNSTPNVSIWPGALEEIEGPNWRNRASFGRRRKLARERAPPPRVPAVPASAERGGLLGGATESPEQQFLGIPGNKDPIGSCHRQGSKYAGFEHYFLNTKSIAARAPNAQILPVSKEYLQLLSHFLVPSPQPSIGQMPALTKKVPTDKVTIMAIGLFALNS